MPDVRKKEEKMFRAGIGCILIALLAGVANADLPAGFPPGMLDSITVSQVGVDFAPGGVGSTLALDAHSVGWNNTTSYFQAGGPVSFEADFDLDTVLSYDWSVSPHAEGWFEGGPLALTYDGGDGDPNNNDLLYGEVDWYWLIEDDNSGILYGAALLQIQGGNLVDSGQWPTGAGSTSSILFSVTPNPDDFQSPFTGTAMVNLFPDDRAIPEPVTLLLLAGGGLLAVRRRR
jgi:hypothetical protein